MKSPNLSSISVERLDRENPLFHGAEQSAHAPRDILNLSFREQSYAYDNRVCELFFRAVYLGVFE